MLTLRTGDAVYLAIRGSERARKEYKEERHLTAGKAPSTRKKSCRDGNIKGTHFVLERNIVVYTRKGICDSGMCAMVRSSWRIEGWLFDDR
jgi:hypothetical protein